MGYFIEHECPSGADYHNLIRFFAEVSDYFELTRYNIRPEGYAEDYDQVMAQLAPYLISKKNTHKNAGNDTRRWHSMTLFRYKLNSTTIRILKESADSLFEWGGRDEEDNQLPEDLTFYQNRKPIFFMVGHEEYAEINLTDEKEIEKFKSLLGTALKEFDD